MAESTQEESPKQQKFVWSALRGSTLILGFLTLSGFWGQSWWIFDLVDSFRVQYYAILTFLSLLFLYAKKRNEAIFAGVFALVNFLLIAPFFHFQLQGVAHAHRDDSMRVVSMNLDLTNRHFEEVRAFIGESDPDFLLLTEFTHYWQDSLAETLKQFPHSIVSKVNNGWDIGLFSNRPLENERLLFLGEVDVPIISANIDVLGTRVNLFGLHLRDPSSKQGFIDRNRQLAGLSRYLERAGGPMIVLGDFNVTPWSAYFKEIIQRTGLMLAPRGNSLVGTWPTYFHPLRIPIDYSLISKGVIVQDAKLGRDVGSDHFPMIIDFRLES